MSTEGRGLVDSGRSSENSANDNYPGLESVGKRPIYAKTVQTGRRSALRICAKSGSSFELRISREAPKSLKRIGANMKRFARIG
jgi:hypothetical protein